MQILLESFDIEGISHDVIFLLVVPVVDLPIVSNIFTVMFVAARSVTTDPAKSTIINMCPSTFLRPFITS
jgi:hypothetical protein